MATAIRKKVTGPASDPDLINKASSYGPASELGSVKKQTETIAPPPGTLYGVNNSTVKAPAPSGLSQNAISTMGTLAGQKANDVMTGQKANGVLTGQFYDPNATPSGVSYGPSGSVSQQQPLVSPGSNPSDRTNKYYNMMYSVENDRPDPFESRYESQIQGILDTIYNRKPFDISTDANYNQLYDLYKEQYTTQADKAMRDTMASMNAATGGYGSTYAGAVAQQAYDSTMQNLNDRNMQLMNLAYGMYSDDRANDYNKLGAFQGQDNIEYGRYRDTVSDWMNDRNYYASQYWNSTGDDESRYQYDTNLEMNKDNIAYDRYWNAVTEANNLAAKGLPIPDYLTAVINEYNFGKDGVSDAKEQLAALAAQSLASSGSGGGGNRTRPTTTTTKPILDNSYGDYKSDYASNFDGNQAWNAEKGSKRTNVNAMGELIDNADSNASKYNIIMNNVLNGLISLNDGKRAIEVAKLPVAYSSMLVDAYNDSKEKSSYAPSFGNDKTLTAGSNSYINSYLDSKKKKVK